MENSRFVGGLDTVYDSTETPKSDRKKRKRKRKKLGICRGEYGMLDEDDCETDQFDRRRMLLAMEGSRGHGDGIGSSAHFKKDRGNHIVLKSIASNRTRDRGSVPSGDDELIGPRKGPADGLDEEHYTRVIKELSNLNAGSHKHDGKRKQSRETQEIARREVFSHRNTTPNRYEGGIQSNLPSSPLPRVSKMSQRNAYCLTEKEDEEVEECITAAIQIIHGKVKIPDGSLKYFFLSSIDIRDSASPALPIVHLLSAASPSLMFRIPKHFQDVRVAKRPNRSNEFVFVVLVCDISAAYRVAFKDKSFILRLDFKRNAKLSRFPVNSFYADEVSLSNSLNLVAESADNLKISRFLSDHGVTIYSERSEATIASGIRQTTSWVYTEIVKTLRNRSKESSPDIHSIDCVLVSVPNLENLERESPQCVDMEHFSKPSSPEFVSIESLSSSRKRFKFSKGELGDILFTYPFHVPSDGEVGIDEITVRKSDLIRTEESVYLNDIVIDFYIKHLLLEEFPRQADLLRVKNRVSLNAAVDVEGAKNRLLGIFAFSSLFLKQMLDKSKESEYRRGNCSREEYVWKSIRNWGRKLDFLTKKVLIVPINDALHWSVMFVCNVDQILPRVLAKSDLESTDLLSRENRETDCLGNDEARSSQSSSSSPSLDDSPNSCHGEKKPSKDQSENCGNLHFQGQINGASSMSEHRDIQRKNCEKARTDHLHPNMATEKEGSLDIERCDGLGAAITKDPQFHQIGKRSITEEVNHSEKNDFGGTECCPDDFESGEDRIVNLLESEGPYAKERGWFGSIEGGGFGQETRSAQNTQHSQSFAKIDADHSGESGPKTEKHLRELDLTKARASLDNTRNPTIICLDSLKVHTASRNASYMKLFLAKSLLRRLPKHCKLNAQLVDEVVANIPCLEAPVPQQPNSHDCGVYVLQFLNEFLRLYVIEERLMLDLLDEDVLAQLFGEKLFDHRVVSDLRAQLGGLMLDKAKQFTKIGVECGDDVSSSATGESLSEDDVQVL